MYKTEYYSAIRRNTFESVLMRWMNLEPIIEWSKLEREKQISYIDTYMWNLERWYWWTYLPSSNGDADIETRLVGTVGKERVGRMETAAWEHYTTICKIDSQREFAEWLWGLRLVLCDLEGWDGWEVGGRFKREGTYAHLWLIHVDVWQEPTQYCKAIILQLKTNELKKI